MNPMKTLIELDEFLIAAQDDHLIHPPHISLYVALFQVLKQCHFIQPIDRKRDDLMRLSKITGRGTYQRCLRDLHAGGYIIYRPCFDGSRNSLIYLSKPPKK